MARKIDCHVYILTKTAMVLGSIATKEKVSRGGAIDILADFYQQNQNKKDSLAQEIAAEVAAMLKK